jgi:hypothetical protein
MLFVPIVTSKENMKETTVNNKIFIAIPSWRDPFMYETIKSAYDQAFDKECLVFGVYFQGYEEDAWMVDRLKSDLSHINIKIKEINGDQASIYLCEIKKTVSTALMTDESYYLQVDSHTKFRKNWDIMLKTELLIANRMFGKSIINSQTSYFTSWSDPLIADPLTSYASNEEWNWIRENVNFDHDISLNGRVVVKPNNLMIKEKFYNGNMVFAYSYYVKDVPFPDGVAQCFEQQTMMLRAWTAGYNVVSPSYLYTNNFNYWRDEYTKGDSFIRHYRWDNEEHNARHKAANLESFENYKKIFDLSTNAGYNLPNGAFKNRTIQEYINFIGYDPITLEIKDAPRVDLANAQFISDKLFHDSLSEVAYQSGYGKIEPSNIINDPFTVKVGSFNNV